MTKAEREKLKKYRRSLSYTVSDLLKVQNEIQILSPRQADELGSIIARLNAWVWR